MFMTIPGFGPTTYSRLQTECFTHQAIQLTMKQNGGDGDGDGDGDVD